jgi:hypothetical protein
MTERHDLRIIAGISIKHYLRFVWLLLAFAAPVQAAVSERILLQASPLAGFQYHAGKQVWGELHEGDALELVREADNVYDPRYGTAPCWAMCRAATMRRWRACWIAARRWRLASPAW